MNRTKKQLLEALQNTEDRREYWSDRWAKEFDMRMEAEKKVDELVSIISEIVNSPDGGLDLNKACLAIKNLQKK